ncbi:RNA-binding cell elongation regulator Jag/EloR [Desulfofundulus thermosubterraneus]|uniref:RNA-binding protein KhpB n=1 Tax=Desulfofundulus thermosubterraneus DSM 16057 TaxID=1121432 RepID=A0A1M6D2K9_9FIRM|nr:RNA-binding cell elongation regulator Jag/EloR [Desulfofundulus thermosubterraneus]SHI67238.1 spoIIIJ-associated protein [Desulfofundulus thermosubterraneus DSM 16057]
MEGVEKTAKTVDEAVSLALAQLGISREEAEIEVLEEPSRGFLGLLGSRPARVRVRVKDTPSRRAKELLGRLLEAMNLPVDMAIEEKENNVFIDIEGKDVGILIGRRGETLDALQYLITLYVNKNQHQRCKVFLDVEGYRRRREETLQRLALKLAEKAKQRGRNVVLEPMTSHERRIIHTALQGRDDIFTYSEGEEPYRKIIISPKK